MDNPFQWELFFVVWLHRHWCTLLRFILLQPNPWLLWLLEQCSIPPHYSLGFHHSLIKINATLTGFLPWFNWGKMNHYYTPISFHLHGTWLYHPGVILHNWGTFLIFHFYVCWILLLQCDVTECHLYNDIHLPSIIQECFHYLMYECFVGFVQIQCLIFWFHILLMCAIFWWYMLVWLIFFPEWCFLLGPLQSILDVSQNVEVHFAALLIPIKLEYNIFFTIPIIQYFILFFD